MAKKIILGGLVGAVIVFIVSFAVAHGFGIGRSGDQSFAE